MVEPISTGAALVGAGAWFANKLLGPSADALGNELKIYASNRLEKIFRRAEQLTDRENVSPLPPGFALQFIQKASFSEDDKMLTEAWANLLANAARSFDNRYALFVDILSQMTTSDAQLFTSIFEISPSPDAVENVQRLRGYMEANYSSVGGPFEFVATMIAQIRELPIGFFGIVRSISMPYTLHSPSQRHADHVEVWYHECNAEIDSLVRNGLMREFSVNIENPYHRPSLEGAEVTALGEQFFAICKGKK
jgi:Abortive infection alpha